MNCQHWNTNIWERTKQKFGFEKRLPVCVLSRFSHVWLSATLWTAACRLLCPWDSPGKSTVAGCHFLLRKSSQPRDRTCVSYVYLYWQAGSLPLAPPGKPLGEVQFNSVQFSSVAQSCQLLATPWTAARQAPLSITNSRSLLKLVPIKSVMPSNHLILCRPLLLLPPVPPSIKVFSNESTSHEVAQVLEFQLQHQTFQWTPRTDLL